MLAATASSPWLIWSDWFVAGVGADIAGAVALAFSFATKNPADIAQEVLLPTRTWARIERGFGKLGESLARQRAEAHVGLALLVSGFVMQLVGYLFPDGHGFNSWRERGVALAFVLAEWALAAVAWKVYVPRITARTFGRAEREREAQVERDRVAAGAEQAAAAGDAGA